MFNEKISYKDIQVEVNLKQNKTITAVNEQDGSDIEIEVIQYLPLGRTSAFVEMVMNSLTTHLGEYMIEHESLIIDKTFLEFYTNIELPKELPDCAVFIAENQPLIRKCMSEVHQEQLHSILNAIEYRKSIVKEKYIKQNDDLDLLVIGIGNIVRNLNDMLEMQKLSFKDIDFTTLIQNLSQKKLSEEKIIDRILDVNTEKKTKQSGKKSNKVVELQIDTQE